LGQLPVDQAEDSHDQLALITGKSEKGARTAHIHNTFANKYAIRDGDWVLVNTASGYAKRFDKAWEKRNGYPEDSSKGGKLFNLKEDLGQKHNVIAKYPEKAEALRTLLKKLQDQGHSAPRLAK
jgi:arylsulfatase A